MGVGMSNKIKYAVAVALLSAGVHGQEIAETNLTAIQVEYQRTNAILTDTITPEYFLMQASKINDLVCATNEIDDTSDTVRRLGESGEICKVYGHMWSDDRPAGDGIYFADYHPGISYRHCRICGKTESKTEVWE
jgi:hypothetical protein